MANLVDYVGREFRVFAAAKPVSDAVYIDRIEGDLLVALDESGQEIRVFPLWLDEPVGSSPLVGADEFDAQMDPDW